ncbi:MAG: hypothetical protein NC350_00895 [Corallococcus sp.]|nr:hypothetical protein [Corallococcus sp.]
MSEQRKKSNTVQGSAALIAAVTVDWGYVNGIKIEANAISTTYGREILKTLSEEVLMQVKCFIGVKKKPIVDSEPRDTISRRYINS